MIIAPRPRIRRLPQVLKAMNRQVAGQQTAPQGACQEQKFGQIRAQVVGDALQHLPAGGTVWFELQRQCQIGGDDPAMTAVDGQPAAAESSTQAISCSKRQQAEKNGCRPVTAGPQPGH